MKKSEIRDELIEYLSSCGKITPLEAADWILHHLEEKGMLPPFSNEMFYNNWVRTRDNDVINGYKWDEEDES